MQQRPIYHRAGYAPTAPRTSPAQASAPQAPTSIHGPNARSDFIDARRVAWQHFAQLTPPRLITSEGEIVTGELVRTGLLPVRRFAVQMHSCRATSSKNPNPRGW